MKYILLILLLCVLSTHWHHKEQTRVREYVYLRSGSDTDCDNAVMQASEHFNLSVEEVEKILDTQGTVTYR